MGNGKRVAVLVLNLKLILLIEIFITFCQSFAVTAAINFQQWGHSHYPYALWFLSEAIGPEPRMFTFLAIALFAKSGVETIRLLSIRFCAHYLRWWLSLILQEPRPSWISTDVEMIHCPNTYGLPSGHALFYIAVFTPIVFQKGRGILPKLAFYSWFIFMCLGRIYLGTHSPHDLFLGTIVGLSLVYIIDEELVNRRIASFQAHPNSGIISISFVVLGILNSLLWVAFIHGRESEASINLWTERIEKNHCKPLSLFSPRDGIGAIAAYFGVLVAIIQKCTDIAPPRLRFLACIIYIASKMFIDIPANPESLVLSSLFYALTSFMMLEPSTEKYEDSPAIAALRAQAYGTVPHPV